MPSSKRQQVQRLVEDIGRARRLLNDMEKRALDLIRGVPAGKSDAELKDEFESVQARAWRLSQEGHSVDEIAEAMLLGKGTVSVYIAAERRRHANATSGDAGPASKRRGVRGPADPNPRLITTPARDGHAHVAEVRADGSGFTTPGPDGHVHAIRNLELGPGPGGHSHQLTEVRA